MKKIDRPFIGIIFAIIIIGVWQIGIPVIYPLDEKTVTKVSNIYEEPLFLTFHWITDDQIQVGKLITLDIELRGLPYKENMTLNEIKINLNETQLNYWSNKSDIENNEILQEDSFVFRHDWANSVFISDPIKIRFIIPTDISLEYCDYNIEPSCYEIKNIIHPAPYDLASSLEADRITILFSLVIIVLSTSIIWSTTRKKH